MTCCAPTKNSDQTSGCCASARGQACGCAPLQRRDEPARASGGSAAAQMCPCGDDCPCGPDCGC